MQRTIHRRVKSASAGFSASELLVLMGVIGVLSAIMYPSLSSLAPSYRLSGAARNLATALQKARLRAIIEGGCFKVVFDTSAKTYQAQKGDSSCASASYVNDGSAQSIDDIHALTVDDGSGNAPASPEFNTRGVVVTASTIRLQNANNGIRTISVQATGRVLVQ